MVEHKVAGFETDAARQCGERGRISADQINPPSKAKTPAPHGDAQCQMVSPSPKGDDDDGGPLEKVLRGANHEFVQGLLRQLLHVSARGRDKFDPADMHFTLGVIEGKKPTDELEMMHLAQMTAVHSALMKASGDLARAETVFEREYLTRAVNQLARTYTAQLEAFNRYRGGDRKQSYGAKRLGCRWWASHRRPSDTGRPCDCASDAGEGSTQRSPMIESRRWKSWAMPSKSQNQCQQRTGVRPDNKRTGKPVSAI